MSSQHIAQQSQLTAESRAKALKSMVNEELDILVVGGGITGAGIALDAATRGLRTGIVEAGDWAAGTSAWSPSSFTAACATSTTSTSSS